MEWLAFLRAAATFGVFYVVAPAVARGQALSSPCGWASAFVRFSLFLELSIFLLGIARLALPGALAILCALWLGLEVFERKTAVLQGSDARRTILASLLAGWKDRTSLWYRSPLCRWREQWKQAILPCLLVATTLAARGWRPVENLRLEDAADYARALSLAVLSSGHDWQPDLSIPLLLPLHYLASLTAPRTVAFSEPLFAAALTIAVAIAAYSVTGKRLPAIAAMTSATLVAVMGGQATPAGNPGEMSGVYLILALALWQSRRSEALVAGLLGVAAAPTVELFHTLIPYAASVGLGVCTAQLAWRRYACAKLATVTALAGIAIFGPGVAAKRRSDGPLQYEEAAGLAYRLAKELPRNSWTLVSRGEELPYVYGRGWHLDVAQFLGDVNLAEAREPSYRLPLPVREVYFLLEKVPLDRSAARSDRGSVIAQAAAPADLARASYEYQLAEWLAAYRGGHDDLVTVYQGEHVTVLRAPGGLSDYREGTR